jgi:hypothetical protein
VSCRLVGEACEAHNDCCSYACFGEGTAFKFCHYLGGCRPYGELCRVAKDCCSSAEPCSTHDPGTCVLFDGKEVGRCELIQGPKQAGEICDDRFEGTHDCCGGDEFCQPSVLGIERCMGEGFTDCIPDGDPCATSDQCCSGLCAPDQNGDLVCNPGETPCTLDGQPCTTNDECCSGNCNSDNLCGPDACVPNGEACTSDAECCSGICDPDTNTCTEQTCADPGEACTTTDDCCSGHCVNGTCVACLPDGETCTADSDCCSGYCNPGTMTCEEDVSPCAGPLQACGTTDDCCAGLECINGICVVL